MLRPKRAHSTELDNKKIIIIPKIEVSREAKYRSLVLDKSVLAMLIADFIDTIFVSKKTSIF